MKPSLERHPHLFPEREPPPGGLTRLRARLREEERRPRSVWFGSSLVGAAVAATLAVGLFAGRREPTAPLPLVGNVAALGLGLARASGPEVIAAGGVVKLPSDDEDVVLYLVSRAPDE